MEMTTALHTANNTLNPSLGSHHLTSLREEARPLVFLWRFLFHSQQAHTMSYTTVVA